MSVSACILSVSGPSLLAREYAFLREAQPWGIILMGRSCQTREQVRALITDIHTALGREALICIDQEGGRVARLKPPQWSKFPAAGIYGKLYSLAPEAALRACEIGYQLLGHELVETGIRANCAPCADLRQEHTHDAIGDRAFGDRAEVVLSLARAALKGLSQAGVHGCMKHLPGQGRARVDSHYDLPRIDASQTELADDFAIFAGLAAHVPMAMTGHVIFDIFDSTDPATVSNTIISDIIRDRIGFDGLLMTDDLGMKALGGSLGQRGQRALAAGCDVLLHCSGFLKDPEDIRLEMEAVAEAAGPLSGQALQRARATMDSLKPPQSVNISDLWQEFHDLIQEVYPIREEAIRT